MNARESVLSFLKDAGVFYVTTVDGDKPKVRLPIFAVCSQKIKQ